MTDKLTKTVHNVSTGETVTRDYDADELAQHKTDETANKIRQTADTAQAAAKKSTYKKLAALGLTADEIAAL